MSKKFYASAGYANAPFPLVAVGASTGGLEAAMTLFSEVPPDSGISFFFLQHTDQTKRADAITLLSEVTPLPVVHAIDGMPVLPDHIYVLSPGKDTNVRNERFVIGHLPPKPLYRMPVDRLFAQLAPAFADRLTGIVLSGVTRDGTLGMQSIKDAGGTTYVQDGSALFNYMPRSALVAGVADRVLSPQQMAALLLQKKAQPKPAPATAKSPIPLQHKPAPVSRQPPKSVKKEIVVKPPVEKEKPARADQLLTSVKNDLQELSYVANHDLKEPLRKISVFGDRLQQNFGQLLPDAGRTYIEKIKSSAQHLTQLLDDLQRFFKVNDETTPFITVNLNDIVERVLHTMQENIQQKKAGISFWSLPSIACNTQQMELLFFHLLDNALKFSHPQRPPEITVTAKKLKPEQAKQMNLPEPSKAYHDIIVSDNGIGFNKDHASQIFVLFQRLNDRREYPGTGVGLSICRKITEIHQGKIYAVSKEGDGASFHIVLPAITG